jgi:16S rRNA U1498 N3-methylase RsmE
LLRSARNDKNKDIWLIWPEWWRWPKDHELFKNYDIETKDLWATILRMETAAIVGGWLLKNNAL